MGTAETLYHVVAETGISNILLQKFQICLDNLLHVCALMVNITASSKVGSLIIVLAEAYTLFGCLCCCFIAIIILADVGRQHLVGHTFVCFSRECEPAVCIAVIDHNISNSTNAVGFELSNQTLEFCLCSERRILVEIIIWLIAHYLFGLDAFTALWKPYKVDESFHIIGLFLQDSPLGVVVRIP